MSGSTLHHANWAWVLPLSLSFYAFQALTYTLDLYRRERNPEEAPETFLARLPQPRVAALLVDLEELQAKDARPEDFIDLGEEKPFEVETSEGECAA